MKFTKALELHKNGTLIKKGGTKMWEINDSFIWWLDYEKKEWYVEIKSGFETDFGSIPKVLQNIFSPTKYISYLLHDKVYRIPKMWREVGNQSYELRKLSRKECDQILFEGIKVEGAGFFERWCIYLGVRIGGWLHYNKKNIL